MKQFQCFILFSIVFVHSHALAQLVDIPDPNLRLAITETLNLTAGAEITQQHMNQLTQLEAASRGILNLTGLEHAKNIFALNISFNDVVDISPVAHLHKLRYFHAVRNRIADITPLRNLDRLEFLDIYGNVIIDHTPVDGLSLSHFTYDQTCEMPPIDLAHRLKNGRAPLLQSSFGVPFSNKPELSTTENIAHHDLVFTGPFIFHLSWRETSRGTTIAGRSIDHAIELRDQHLNANPNMIFLVDIRMRSLSLDDYDDDWPYWIKNANGNIVRAWEDPNGTVNYGLIDFTHPVIQDRIVQRALAVARCGLFDGVMFDWWNEHDAVLRDLTDWGIIYVGNEAEQQARDNILARIRAASRPDFLITGNVNITKIPRTGPMINGGSMESVFPDERDAENIEYELTNIENTLLWLDSNIRQPRINMLEGRSIPTQSPFSPDNLRWVRALTTLSLTHSDGYFTINHLTPAGEWGHYWYDFWDADLGQPVGEKGQLYQDIEGLYIREFTNGWAVYNHSGEPQIITLPEEVQGVASGSVNTVHALPNLDGEMYLKKTAPMDSPGTGGSGTYIAEPIPAVPGAALLLDASNNPGSIARWVNLGAAGGRLLASDRLPTVEEGEIEIPTIGFSGRRRYYTATASGQTFGGPIQLNPQLYLGDWTLEFLCKRNGDLFSLEHHFAGFQNSPREGLQGIRLGLLLDDQELDMSIHADGFKQPTRALNIFLEENVWTWVTIVAQNGESIIAYQDGVEVSHHPGVHFDASVPLNDISIGANSYEERHRNFNGSFAIVRVYDRALSSDEVLQNIGATVIPITNPADVNGDGVVNILDLVAVAQGFGTDSLEADVNGDGVVNVFDLVQVAGAIGGAAAAPSADSPELSNISAADVERWLAHAQGLGIVDANFQRGIRFLEGLLAALTPKETTLLPNFPNPFNPETWIPYRLAREAEVMITIYDTKGRLVRRLALGNQAAGHYAERGKAAYWDGRNERGEAVASGIYIYQFRAGDYAAARRLVIVK